MFSLPQRLSFHDAMVYFAGMATFPLSGAADRVMDFLKSRQNSNGGFADRTGGSDLYYTAFGLDGIVAFEQASASGTATHTDTPRFPAESKGDKILLDSVYSRAGAYLKTFQDGSGLDLIHACCLARAWRTMTMANQTGFDGTEKLAARIESFRVGGGFHNTPHSPHASVYATFLAIGAFQDLGIEPPGLTASLDFLQQMQQPDGSWANEIDHTSGSTNPTAAAATCLAFHGRTVTETTIQWLLSRQHPTGGFCAAPQAPLPDILSTSTALFALLALGHPLDSLKESVLNFSDSLWSAQGGFYGHWNEDILDVEYTFYGLLTLGVLELG